MNEKLINYIKEEIDREIKFCLETRRDYAPEHNMFHFYTGALAYLKDMYVTVCNAETLYKSENK